MAEVNIDIEVRCDTCGSDLTVEVSGGIKYIPDFIIEPCEKCLDDARSEGYDEGYQEGVDQES